MRVGADCDIPAAQLAETPYERFVGQGSSDWLEQPRNIDFEGFFVLYKYTENAVNLLGVQGQIGIIALSLDYVAQRIGQVREAVEMLKRGGLNKLVKIPDPLRLCTDANIKSKSA